MGIMKLGVSFKEKKSRSERMEQIIKRTFRGSARVTVFVSEYSSSLVTGQNNS